jgi:hypothetical protein
MQYKMRFLLLLIILPGHFSYGQKCADDSLFNRFKNDIQIELRRHGQISWDDETRESYYTLMISCPIESLVKYVDDPIPAIRCLIFGGLAQKNASEELLTQIASKFKNDSAEYKDSPTDVVTTWTVSDFMQTVLKFKIDKKIPNSAGDFESRLKTVRDRFRIIIPGEYHGIISKDSLLVIDSLAYPSKEYKIVSFSLLDINKTIVTNNIFTEEIRNYIRNMASGDFLVISEIFVEDSNKRRRKVPSIALEIK